MPEYTPQQIDEYRLKLEIERQVGKSFRIDAQHTSPELRELTVKIAKDKLNERLHQSNPPRPAEI